jgi:hypothetical protein
VLRFAGRVAKSDGDIGAGLSQSEGGSTSETARAASDETSLAAQGLGIGSKHFRILLLKREQASGHYATVSFFLNMGVGGNGRIAA